MTLPILHAQLVKALDRLGSDSGDCTPVAGGTPIKHGSRSAVNFGGCGEDPLCHTNEAMSNIGDEGSKVASVAPWLPRLLGGVSACSHRRPLPMSEEVTEHVNCENTPERELHCAAMTSHDGNENILQCNAVCRRTGMFHMPRTHGKCVAFSPSSTPMTAEPCSIASGSVFGSGYRGLDPSLCTLSHRWSKSLPPRTSSPGSAASAPRRLCRSHSPQKKHQYTSLQATATATATFAFGRSCLRPVLGGNGGSLCAVPSIRERAHYGRRLREQAAALARAGGDTDLVFGGATAWCASIYSCVQRAATKNDRAPATSAA